MPTLNRLKWTFACLYFVQGGAISYFSLFQKPYLNKLGIERETIALLSTLMLAPFILKIFFGFISDRFSHPTWGKRLPYMISGLALASLFFLLASFFPASSYLKLYSFFVLAASFSIAFFDAATDGLAIDLVSAKDQGSIQSFMVGGKAIGVILLSQSIGHLVESRGYPFVFLCISLVFILPLILCLGLKKTNFSESTQTETSTPQKISISKLLFSLMAVYGICYSFISFGSDGLISLYLSETHSLSESQIGNYGSIRGIGAIAGSILAGVALSVFSKKQKFVHILSLALMALGLVVIGSSLSASNYPLIGFMWGSIWAFQEVCFLTLIMAQLSGTQSAFAFASLMAMANLGTAIGEAVLTTMTTKLSYQVIFNSQAPLLLVPLLFLLLIFKTKKKAC